MAIELVNSGKVLLFPGDAQVGNWLGWHELVWDVNGEEVNIKNLLKKTVFYKVGHHGSHNATLKEMGLELMTNSHLAAMVCMFENRSIRRASNDSSFSHHDAGSISSNQKFRTS